MNPDTGKFHIDDGTLPQHWPRFALGEEIYIKGHAFVIVDIDLDGNFLKVKHADKGGIVKKEAGSEAERELKKRLQESIEEFKQKYRER